MAQGDRAFPGGAGGAADAETARGPADRRRPTVARLRFDPDPRRVRELLAEVDAVVADRDSLGRRRVRLLVGEILGRLVEHCPHAPIQLDLELKADSVRIDVVVGDAECDFWGEVDDVVFTDLTSGWGRDRRRDTGAWFEVEAVPRRASRPAVR